MEKRPDLHKIMNHFWMTRRSQRITNLQADVYYFLVNEWNARYWENPFYCANTLIMAGIGISEPSLLDARNRLKQMGFIDFEAGERKKCSPLYTMLYLNKLGINRVEAEVKTEYKPSINTHLLKQVPNKYQTKPNETFLAGKKPAPEKKVTDVPPKEKTAPRKKAPGPAADVPVRDNWQKFVDTFHKFYSQQFKDGNNEPGIYNFGANEKNKGMEFKDLGAMYDILKKRAELRKIDWNEVNMVDAFGYFLDKAYKKDQWIRNNFTIPNILKQFNIIINEARQQSTAQSAGRGEKPTNAGVNAAFSTLYKRG